MASAWLDDDELLYPWQDTIVELYNHRREGIADWIGQLKKAKNTSELQAWKVTEDGIVFWELAAKGKFFSDEVYIVLNRTDPQTTSIPERKIGTPCDIYCWVGKSAAPDLYRKGLYNATALNEALEGVLQDVPVLVHREVQDFESKRFKRSFKFFTVLKGRSDGFHTCTTNTKFRLLRVTGPVGGTLCIRETSFKRGAMRESNDVFIGDTGLKIYLWIGSRSSSSGSKFTKAQEYVKELKEERNRGKGVTLLIVYDDETSKDHPFFAIFPPQAKKPIEAKTRKSSSVRTQRELVPGVHAFLGQSLNRKFFEVIPLSNPPQPGNFEYRNVKLYEGENVSLSKMDSETKVYVVHVSGGEDHVFVQIGEAVGWIGEKGNGLMIAHDFLKKSQREKTDPGILITVVKAGQLSIQLRAAVGLN